MRKQKKNVGKGKESFYLNHSFSQFKHRLTQTFRFLYSPNLSLPSPLISTPCQLIAQISPHQLKYRYQDKKTTVDEQINRQSKRQSVPRQTQLKSSDLPFSCRLQIVIFQMDICVHGPPSGIHYYKKCNNK